MSKDITLCYGKKIDCQSRKKCPWGEPCLSLAREPLEDRHYQIQNISLPNVLFDGTEKDNDTAAKIDPLSIYSEREKEDACTAEAPLELLNITIPPDAMPFVLKVIEQIAYFHFHMPNVLEALFEIIFKGKNQSDIAKEKNITRQCENKRLLRELSVMQKHKDIQYRRDEELKRVKSEYASMSASLQEKEDFLQSLSGRDFAIFKYRFCQKYTAPQTAKTVGCDLRTVFRVSRFIRQKLNIPVMVSGRRKKKNAKNNPRND